MIRKWHTYSSKKLANVVDFLTINNIGTTMSSFTNLFNEDTALAMYDEIVDSGLTNDKIGYEVDWDAGFAMQGPVYDSANGMWNVTFIVNPQSYRVMHSLYLGGVALGYYPDVLGDLPTAAEIVEMISPVLMNPEAMDITVPQVKAWWTAGMRLAFINPESEAGIAKKADYAGLLIMPMAFLLADMQPDAEDWTTVPPWGAPYHTITCEASVGDAVGSADDTVYIMTQDGPFGTLGEPDTEVEGNVGDPVTFYVPDNDWTEGTFHVFAVYNSDDPDDPSASTHTATIGDFVWEGGAVDQIPHVGLSAT